MSRKSRTYSLVFGQPLKLTDDFFLQPLLRGSYNTIDVGSYYNENDPNAYLIDQHEISFRITKSDKGINGAEIVVKNLSEKTKNYLLTNRGNHLTVALKVGYDGENKLLFQGLMSDCAIMRNGENDDTRLLLEDGKINVEKAFTSRVYPVGTKLSTIVTDLILDQATPVGYVDELPSTIVTKTSYNVFGESNKLLQRILSGYDYSSTINDGKMYILPLKSRLAETVAYISPDTGLIGSVTGLTTKDKTVNATDLNLSNLPRIRFTCQIDATISPMSSVFVKDPSSGVKGAYRVEKALFRCSSFETGSFEVVVDAIQIDATVV